MQGLTADDLVIALMSGGGSSLMVLPAGEMTLVDKQAVNHLSMRFIAVAPSLYHGWGIPKRHLPDRFVRATLRRHRWRKTP